MPISKGTKTRPTKLERSTNYSLRLPLEEQKLSDIITRTNRFIVPPELYLNPNDESVRARVEGITEQLRRDQTTLLEAGIAPLAMAGYVALKPLETYKELLKIIALNLPRDAEKIVDRDFRERGYRPGSEEWKSRRDAWSDAYRDAQNWQCHLRGLGGPTKGERSKIETIIQQESTHAISMRPYIPDAHAGPNRRLIDASCVPLIVIEKDKTIESVQQKVERKGTSEFTARDAGQLFHRYNRSDESGSLAQPYNQPAPTGEKTQTGKETQTDAETSTYKSTRGFINLDKPITITDMSGMKLVYQTEREMRKGIVDFMAKAREAGCTVAHDEYGETANEDYFHPKKRKTYRDSRTGKEEDLNYEAVHILFQSPSDLPEVVEVQFTTLDSFIREFFGTRPSNHRIYEAKKGWAVATPKAFSAEGDKREAYGTNHERLIGLVHKGWT